METLLELWRTFLVLWERGERPPRRVLLLTVGAIVFWPVLFTLAALLPWGPGTVVAIVTLLGPLGTALWLSLLPYWTGGVTVAAGLAVFNRGRLGDEARRLFRAVTLVLTGELLIGAFYVFIPVRKDPALIPIIMLVFMTLLFMRISGLKARWLTRLLVWLAIGITLVFLLGGRATVSRMIEEAREKATTERQTVELVEAEGENPLRAEVVLQGPRHCVGPVVITDQKGGGVVPAYWDYFFAGPSKAQARFDDGAAGSLEYWNQWVGIKGGRVCFTGPAGQTVKILAYPPG